VSEPNDTAKRLFHFDEGVVSMPGGFRDRSSQILEWTVDNTSSVVLVIQRERLTIDPRTQLSLTLDDVVARETGEYPTRFLGFRLDPNEFPDPTDGTLPLRRIVFRWKSDREVLYHHQVFVLSDQLVLTLTMSSSAAHRDRADHVIQEALSSLRFRED